VEGDPARYPVKKPRKKIPHVPVVAGALEKNGTFLLGRRAGGMLAGLWEFPGGKVEPAENPKTALAREWREELGVRIEVGRLLGAVDHAYSHFTMTLSLHACRLRRGSPAPRALKHTELCWAGAEAFDRLALPAADRRLLAFLPLAALG
jgi:A/G-specific adenine glycosylase